MKYRPPICACVSPPQFCLLVLMYWAMCFWAIAQTTLRGVVRTERNVPVAAVQVSVNNLPPVMSDAQGEFVVLLAAGEQPKALRATKDGLVMSDWQWSNNQLSVLMTMPRRVRGRVVSTRGMGVGNIQVLLLGVRGLQTVKTDAAGNFTLDLPQNVPITTQSRFVVYDAGRSRLKNSTDYETEIASDGSILLRVNIPALALRRVRVLDAQKKPLAGVRVQAQGRELITDAQGEFAAEGLTDESAFAIENYRLRRDFDEVERVLHLIALPNDADNTPQNQIIAAQEDIAGRRNTITLAYDLLNNQNRELEAREQAINRALNANISPQERARLEAELVQIRRQLADNTLAIRFLREEAELAIAEYRDKFLREEAAGKKTRAQLSASETQRAQAEQRSRDFQRQVIIAILAAIILGLLASLFVFQNRRIRRQRAELAEKNILLTESAQILDRKNQEIEAKNTQLLVQTHELEQKNHKITDSIRYGYSIQQSILPDHTQLQAALSSFFLLYSPKDIVSGDFYWVNTIEGYTLLAVADCTGHGVPGAFMTMLGSAILNQLINEQGLKDPAEILTLLNQRVLTMIRQEEDLREGDGMDMAMIAYHRASRTLQFAGAKMHLYYLTPEATEVLTLKATNLSIGTSGLRKNKFFTNQTLILTGEEIFYLVSDGYYDQLGGSTEIRRKFSRQQMFNIMLAERNTPLPQQQAAFKAALEQWKAHNDQTDDIVLLGFRL